MNPMMDLRSTLFVGNLSVFCTEIELEQVFAPYGTIMEIRMAKSEDQSKHLSYGFVKYANVASAQLAMHELNGQILCGRPLKIGKALSRTTKKGNEPPEPHQDYTTASVHVTFISHQIVRIVTEESLRYLFGRFGPVVDAVICKSNIDRRQGRQSGYGFIHYPGNQQGVEASFVAADTLMDVMIDEVNYKCKISHHLEQHLRAPGLGPVVSAVAAPVAAAAQAVGGSVAPMVMIQPGGPSALPPSMPTHHGALGMAQQQQQPLVQQGLGLVTQQSVYGPAGHQQHQLQQTAPSLPLYQRYGMNNSPQVGAMSMPSTTAPSLSSSNPTSPYGAYNIPAAVHHHHPHHQQQLQQHQLQSSHNNQYSQQQNNYGTYGITLPPRAPPSQSSFSHSNDAYQAAMESYRGIYPAAEMPLGIPVSVSRDGHEESNRMIKQPPQQPALGGGQQQQQQMYQFQAQQQQQQLVPFAQPSPISPQSFYNTLSPPGYYQSNNNNSNYNNNSNRPIAIAAELPPTLSQPPHPQQHQGQGQVSGLFEQAIQQSTSSSSKSVEFPSDSTKTIISMPSIGSAHSRSTEVMGGAFEAMSLSASSGASALASYTSTENISQYPSLMIARGPNTPNTSTHRMMPQSSTSLRKTAIDALYGGQPQMMTARDMAARDMRRFDSSASISQENVVSVKDVDEDLFTATVEASIDEGTNNNSGDA